MPPQLVTYVTFQELNNGTSSTLGEFRSYLSRFSTSRIVYICNVVNSILKTWRGGVDLSAHEILVGAFFEPTLASALTALGKSSSKPRFVFHRTQLLFVAKEALLHCEEKEDTKTGDQWPKLGLAFLMANDQLNGWGSSCPQVGKNGMRNALFSTEIRLF